MPQDPVTAEQGKRLIKAGLNRERIFEGRQMTISAVPTAPDCIRFDVKMVTNYGEPVVLSISQNI